VWHQLFFGFSGKSTNQEREFFELRSDWSIPKTTPKNQSMQHGTNNNDNNF
jgi:hypothetical protein